MIDVQFVDGSGASWPLEQWERLPSVGDSVLMEEGEEADEKTKWYRVVLVRWFADDLAEITLLPEEYD